MAEIRRTRHVPADVPRELAVYFPPYIGAFLQGELNFDPAAALSGLQQPCLLLQGSADQQVVPLDDIQPLLDALSKRSAPGEAALFPLVVGDLYDRVRPVDQPYFRESRGKRLGTTDFAAYQAKAREGGLATFRFALEPARRSLREQPFLAGDAPAYPDYALIGAFLWARIASPFELLADDDPVRTWRERMLDLHGGLGRNARAA